MPDDLNAAPTDLHWLTIADAARLIERRHLSPVELTEALIARADPAAAFSIEPPSNIRAEPVTDLAVREIVLAACRRNDLSLNDGQVGTVCHGDDAKASPGARFSRGTR